MRTRIAILITAAVVLGGCQTTKVDQAIQDTLPKACRAMQVAYTGFTAIATTGVVRQRVVDKVNAAYVGANLLCDDPQNATTADVIIRVTQATIVITQGLKEVKNEPV